MTMSVKPRASQDVADGCRAQRPPITTDPRRPDPMTPARFDRRARLAAAGALMAIMVAACGGGSSPSNAASTPTPRPASTTEASTPASQAPSGGSTGTVDLAALTPAAKVAEVLGESPTPECKTSVAFGGDSCVWTAADGSWVKVEHRVTPETPTLDAFKQRMTGTLGLDQPVEGLGEGAYLGTSSRGARIATYLGDGLVVWVVITKPGDAATQSAQATAMAEEIIAGL
jgi:hypothetical protein